MICKKCGAELPEDMQFCGKCGEPIATKETPSSNKPAEPDEQSAENTNASQASKKSRIILLAIVGALIAALAIGIIFASINTNTDDAPVQFKKLFNNRDYKEARELLSAIKDDEDDYSELNAWACDEGKAAVIDYNNGDEDYEMCLERIEELEKCDLSTSTERLLQEQKELLKKLPDSKAAYELGTVAQREGNYITAINQYRLVIEEDYNIKSAYKNTVECLNDKYNAYYRISTESKEAFWAEVDLILQERY